MKLINTPSAMLAYLRDIASCVDPETVDYDRAFAQGAFITAFRVGLITSDECDELFLLAGLEL